MELEAHAVLSLPTAYNLISRPARCSRQFKYAAIEVILCLHAEAHEQQRTIRCLGGS